MGGDSYCIKTSCRHVIQPNTVKPTKCFLRNEGQIQISFTGFPVLINARPWASIYKALLCQWKVKRMVVDNPLWILLSSQAALYRPPFSGALLCEQTFFE
jgi:hypothetical protein